MSPGSAPAWLAAFALLLPAAPATAGSPTAGQSVPVVGDERIYKNAMECKVRLEALVAVARNDKERRRIEQALALWTDQEKAVGSKLGKSQGDMLKDEIFFGMEEGSRPGALQRANICLQHAAAATRYR